MRKLLFAVTAMLVFLASNQTMAFDAPGTSVSTKIELTAEQALARMKADNPNLTGDFFLMESSDTTEWKFFVNPEPNMNWGHECYIYTMPRKMDVSQQIITTPQVLNFPPADNMRAMERTYSTPPAHSSPILPPITPHMSTDTTGNHIYAVILSGGDNINSNAMRFWCDCAYIYRVLRGKYGVPKENLIPLMADGADGKPDMKDEEGIPISQDTDLDGDRVQDIFYAATKGNYYRVMDEIAEKINPNDHFFLFVIDHGDLDDSTGESLICLWNGGVLTQHDVRFTLQQITAKGAMVSAVFGECYSGGFVNALKDLYGCVVVSACQPDESSWSLNGWYDEFVYHWTLAMDAAEPDSSESISPYVDLNQDGKVSMEEAFLLAKSLDSADETPMYSSCPTNLGKELAFRKMPVGIDPYIKAYDSDTGAEPDSSYTNCFNSPSIWVRHNEDGGLIHQNPVIGSGKSNYVYVRVHNRGIMKYTGGQKLTVYWSLNSILNDRSAWFDEDKTCINTLCGSTESVEIPPIEPQSYVDVPLYLGFKNIMGSVIDGEQSIGFLAEIQPVDDEESRLGKDVFTSIHTSNNFACTKKTIINNFKDKWVQPLVNTHTLEAAYNIEFIPEGDINVPLDPNGNVEVLLAKDVARKWLLSGARPKGAEILGEDEDGNLRMKLISSATFDNVKLGAGEHTDIAVKITKAMQGVQRFIMNIRDKDGKIIGGQVFEISPKQTGKFPVTANQSENGEIELSIEGEYDSPEWTDALGNHIGSENQISVTPTLSNYTFRATAIDVDGNIAEGDISLEGMFGIKQIEKDGGMVTVKLHSSAPANAVIVVSSTTEGTEKRSAPIPPQSDEITLDCNALQTDIYTISYLVDNVLVDSINFSIN